MDFKSITWSLANSVGVVKLNRPDRLNALNLSMLNELDTVITIAESDPAVRCILITGEGRGFSAGADIKEWGNEGAEDGSPAESWITVMHRVMARLYRLPKPVIAAVNGVAVGAGFDLTLVADLRIASTSAKFGQVYVNVGFCPDAGGSFLLPRLVGPTRASELIFTGRIINAEEANDLGFLNMVVDPDDLMDAAMEWAQNIAAGPTIAIGLAKENIRQGAIISFEDALRNERRSGEICSTTDDHREGLAAAMGKRAPIFTGS